MENESFMSVPEWVRTAIEPHRWLFRLFPHRSYPINPRILVMAADAAIHGSFDLMVHVVKFKWTGRLKVEFDR
jgi:hypothetical protein